MKKFSRIFFSLIITLFAASMVFSFSAVNVQAATNVGDVNPGVASYEGGPSNSEILLYKVSVYVDEDHTATKESPYTEFEKRVIAYYYKKNTFKNDVNNKNRAVYIGGNSKFEYAANPYSLNSQRVKEVKNDKFIYKSNLPNVDIYDQSQAGLQKGQESIINYFFGSEEQNSIKFVKELYPGVNEDDSWILIVEPTIRTVRYTEKTNVYYYTPTEFAVALNCDSYDSFDFYGFKYRAAGYTLQNAAQLGYMKNGTWLGMRGSESVDKTWNKDRLDKNPKDGIINKKEFTPQIDNFIKYAGVFVCFSGAFEKSDYTLGEAQNIEEFENATKKLSFKVKRTNPAKDETVNVTLDLPNTYGAKITKNEATQSITFPKGVAEKTVSWEINVGSYGDTSNSRSYNYNISIETSDKIETDEMMKNNQLEGTITLKRDFKVTRISLNKDDCFENENVKVSFTVENANPYKEYNEVPVTVFFTYGDRTAKIGEAVVNLGKRGIKNGSCSINVGNVTDNADQTDTVSVVVNSRYVSAEYGSRYSEPDMSNNKKTGTVKVKRDINLSVSIVYRDSWGNPIGNAPSKVKNSDKTQAVTTCAITNHSRFNLYESDPMNDRVTVTFYVNDKKVGSQSVPIPRYGSNLVWFKWDVPEGSSVTLKAEITWNVNQERAPSPYIDNTATKNLRIDTVKEYATHDMGGKDRDKLGSNANYSNAYAYYRMKPSVAKWSQWICDEKGVFTRIDYAMTGDSTLELIPDKEAQFYDGSTILSGSGFGAVFSYKVRTECSEAGYSVSEKDYTYAQTVVATFPEFNYTTKGECKTMYLVKEDGKLNNAEFRFAENASQDKTRKKRIHFTPKDMPDGEYKMGVVADHMWTPAGPIYVNAASSLMINGSAANDYMVQ